MTNYKISFTLSSTQRNNTPLADITSAILNRQANYVNSARNSLIGSMLTNNSKSAGVLPHFQGLKINLANKFDSVNSTSPYIKVVAQPEGTSTRKTIPQPKRKQTNLFSPDELYLKSFNTVHQEANSFILSGLSGLTKDSQPYNCSPHVKCLQINLPRIFQDVNIVSPMCRQVGQSEGTSSGKRTQSKFDPHEKLPLNSSNNVYYASKSSISSQGTTSSLPLKCRPHSHGVQVNGASKFQPVKITSPTSTQVPQSDNISQLCKLFWINYRFSAIRVNASLSGCHS
jgi:hypothetical protein